MKKLILIPILIACLCGLVRAADDYIYLHICMTESRWKSDLVQTNLPSILCDFWGVTDDEFHRQWVMLGVNSNYMAVVNTNITVCEYLVTVKQCKKELQQTLTTDEMTKIKNKIKNDPQIKAAINRTPAANRVEWGITNKPTVGEPQ